MSSSTPTPAADDESARGAGDTEADDARVEAELAPEELLLTGWLPESTPTDGPAPAP